MRYSPEDIAEVCWKHNRALQAVDREAWPDEPWLSAPKWRKTIVMKMVLGVLGGNLRSARDTHEFWRAEMESEGWEPGDKDPVRRRHPNLIPWDKLQDWQRLAQEANFSTITKMGAVP